jgi:hypothetical protein
VAAFPAVDGNKKNFQMRVNPQWHVMRQGFSFGHVHAEKYLISLFAGKPKLVGMARCAVPAPAERKGGTNVVGSGGLG